MTTSETRSTWVVKEVSWVKRKQWSLAQVQLPSLLSSVILYWKLLKTQNAFLKNHLGALGVPTRLSVVKLERFINWACHWGRPIPNIWCVSYLDLINYHQKKINQCNNTKKNLHQTNSSHFWKLTVVTNIHTSSCLCVFSGFWTRFLVTSWNSTTRRKALLSLGVFQIADM